MRAPLFLIAMAMLAAGCAAQPPETKGSETEAVEAKAVGAKVVEAAPAAATPPDAEAAPAGAMTPEGPEAGAGSAAIAMAGAGPEDGAVVADAVEAPDPAECARLQTAMQVAEDGADTARGVAGAGRAASMAASVLSFVPGVGLAALAVKGAGKMARMAGKDAERKDAAELAESRARWEEMGCRGV